MTIDENTEGQWDIDTVKSYWRNHGKIFVAVFLTILALTMLVTFAQTDQFVATSRLVVEKQSRSVLPTREAIAGQTFKDADIVDTEVETLYSTLLARRVVEELKLSEDTEFSDSRNLQSGTDQVALNLIEQLDIRRVGETYLIDIIARSEDAKKAAQIANSYAKQYLELQEETKQATTRRTNELLADRIAAMASKVEQAEHRVQQFKIANGLMSVNGATLAEQSIAAIDNDLARAKAEERSALGRLQAVMGSAPRLAAAQTAALETLVTQRANAEQEWRQAEQTFGERHPNYLAARSRADELQRAVANEVQRAQTSYAAKRYETIDRLRSEARAASQRRASLASSVDSTRRSLAQTNAAQVQLNILERKAGAVRATYEAYLVRFQETATEMGAEQPDARVISPASVPRQPAIPNRLLLLTFGLLFAFLAAISVVLASTSFRRYRRKTES